jgi:hypothetical protein
VPLRQYAQLFAGTLRLLNVDTRVVMMFQPMPVRPKVAVFSYVAFSFFFRCFWLCCVFIFALFLLNKIL